VAFAVLAAVMLLPSELYEVVDKGHGPGIVPYDSGLVYKVRVLDSLTLYAPEEARPHPDKLTSMTLTAATTMMLMAFVLLRAARSVARLRTFFAWAAAGLAVLAVDETFALHELLGHNLHFFADVPGVERPDDLIFGLYPIAAAVFAWRFRDLLLAGSAAVGLFAVGGFFLLIAVAADLAGSPVDELAEPVAGLCLIAGLVVITAGILRRELELTPVAAPSPSRGAREDLGAPVRHQA
jgi:hypothetical protein